MLKSFVVAGVTALSVAAGAVGPSLAQDGSRGDGPRSRASAEDRAAFADARLAGLKAGLRLTAEQEKHWPALETAVRELSKQRAERRADRQQMRRERFDDRRELRGDRRGGRDEGREARREERSENRADWMARLRRGADAMSARANAMTKLVDAAEPLYNSLDESQKRRFAVLVRATMRPGMGPQRHHWRGHKGGDRQDL